MMVVKLYMWPRGRSDRERFIGAAFIDCLGQAARSIPAAGIREGERAYRVRLLKMPQFGGPTEEQLADTEAKGTKRAVWRTGFVRGHQPGKRGTWDLIGGALGEMLGARLKPYVSFTPTKPAPAEAVDMDGDVSELGTQQRYALMELPPPVPEGPEVFADLIDWVDTVLAPEICTAEVRRALVDELQARRDLGLARYGQTLHRDDGRPEGVDALQELEDLSVYAHRDLLRAEHEHRDADAEHHRVIREGAARLMARQLAWLRAREEDGR